MTRQAAHYQSIGAKRTGDTWVKQLSSRLLQLSHNQWIFRCTYTHHRAEDGLKKKERQELRKEMLLHFNMGADSLLDDDKFLLNSTWTDLWKLDGPEKRAWLQAVKSARRISTNARRGKRRKRSGTLVSMGSMCSIFCFILSVVSHLGAASATLRCPILDTGISTHRHIKPRATLVSVSCRTLVGDFKNHIGVDINGIPT